MEINSENIPDLVKKQFEISSQNLLNSIGDLIDTKLSGRETSKSEKKFTFKKKGNEMQYDVNSKVTEHLQSAKRFLCRAHETQCDDEGVKMGIKRAHDEIDDALDVVNHRNKLIKLADMSEAGWAAVSEYETHQLADDSEDEKRIQKAESRAMRKLKENQKKRSAKRSRFFTPTTSTVTSQNTITRRPGVCFSCGKPGHWKSECLAAKSMSMTPSDQQRDAGNRVEAFKMSNCQIDQEKNDPKSKLL